MIYPARFKTNVAWLTLMILFALVIIRPDVAGVSNIAVLAGWVVLLAAFVAECALLSECLTADVGTDQAKRAKAIDFLRNVNAKLAAVSKFRRIRGDVKLYLLTIAIAFTGNIFLAVMFVVLRLMRALGEFTGVRVIEEYDSKVNTTDRDFTPTPPAAR